MNVLKRIIRLIGVLSALCLAFAVKIPSANAESVSYAGFKNIRENGAMSLHFNEKTGAVIIKNSENGSEWRTTPENFDADESIKPNIKMNYDSQLIIKYADQSGNIYELSSAAFCVKKGGLTSEKITDGVRASYYFPKCKITVPVDYTLKGNEFTASVVIKDIKEEDSSYRLTGWSLLPYFNAGGKQEDGFLFVPDGCGAVINFNNGKSAYKTYKQYVYGRDGAIDITAASGHTENALLPVFGTSASNGSSVAVITSGEARCSVNAQVTSSTESYNSVYSEFIYRDSTMASFNDKSWNKKEVRVFENAAPKLDKLSVTYFLLGPDTGYTDMALCYQNYLVKNGVLKEKTNNSYYPLFVNAYGSVNAVKHILGFPVKSEIALTKYGDAVNILKELKAAGADSTVLKYNNWIKGGPESRIPLKAAASGTLGGKSGLKKLTGYLNDNGINGYFDVNITDMYKSRLGYIKTMDSAKMLNQSPVIKYQYSLSTLQKKETDAFWYLLNPIKVNKAAEKIAASLKKTGVTGVSCDTLGTQLYSSYNEKGMDRVSAQAFFEKSLEKLKKSAGKMLLSAPNAYALKYADEISSLPTQSSGYGITDYDVPFYQTVIHGFIPYAMEPANKTGDFEKSVLTALETGSSLQLEVIARNSDKIDDTQFYTLYANMYGEWINKAAESYKEIGGVLKGVSGAKIKEHTVLSDGVRRTAYDNGVTVTVNYNNSEAEVNGEKIPAMGYTVNGGEGL